jgi:hypothetical protein
MQVVTTVRRGPTSSARARTVSWSPTRRSFSSPHGVRAPAESGHVRRLAPRVFDSSNFAYASSRARYGNDAGFSKASPPPIGVSHRDVLLLRPCDGTQRPTDNFRVTLQQLHRCRCRGYGVAVHISESTRRMGPIFARACSSADESGKNTDLTPRSIDGATQTPYLGMNQSSHRRGAE